MWLLTITQHSGNWGRDGKLVMQQDSTFKKKNTQETRNATNCVTQGVLYFLFLEIIDRWTKLFGNKSCFAHLLALRWVTVIGSSLLGKFAYTKSQAKVRQENPFLCQVEWQQTRRWETQQPRCLALWRLVEFLFSPSQSFQHSSRKMWRWGHLQRLLPSVCLLDWHGWETPQWCTSRLSPEMCKPVVNGR